MAPGKDCKNTWRICTRPWPEPCTRQTRNCGSLPAFAKKQLMNRRRPVPRITTHCAETDGSNWRSWRISRRKTARSLHGELCGFTADLMDQVAQNRKQVRQELGFTGQAPVKAKAKRARVSQSHARQEEPQKQSTPRKSMPRKAKASSAAVATKASPVNAKRQAKAKKTVKAAAGARTQKRRVH